MLCCVSGPPGLMKATGDAADLTSLGRLSDEVVHAKQAQCVGVVFFEQGSRCYSSGFSPVPMGVQKLGWGIYLAPVCVLSFRLLVLWAPVQQRAQLSHHGSACSFVDGRLAFLGHAYGWCWVVSAP